jgi:hypothetical protein
MVRAVTAPMFAATPRLTRARQGRNDGREQSFRIAGEDEADPSCGTVYVVTPGRAVLAPFPTEAKRDRTV